MKKTPTSVSVVLIIQLEGNILLVRQRKRKDSGWALPKGQVESDESIDQAAIREAKEQTGLEITLGNLLGIYQVRTPEMSQVVFVFRTGIVKGSEPKDNAREAVELGWFSPYNIGQMIESVNWCESEYSVPILRDWLKNKESHPLNLIKEIPNRG